MHCRMAARFMTLDAAAYPDVSPVSLIIHRQANCLPIHLLLVVLPSDWKILDGLLSVGDSRFAIAVIKSILQADRMWSCPAGLELSGS